MIEIKDYLKVGTFVKPHGVKGELAMSFTVDIFDDIEEEGIVCLMDNIPVPFFVEEYRFKGNATALLKLEDIDDDVEAKMLSGHDVYFRKDLFQQEGEELYLWEDFIQYELIDKRYGSIGTIEAIEDSTLNILFVVLGKSGEEILLPANGHLIEEIDVENKVVYMDIPEGLLTI